MITLDQGGAGVAMATIISPPEALRRRVRCLWVERPSAFRVPKRRTWRIVPDHCGHLLYHRMTDGTRLSLVGPRGRTVDVGKGGRSFTIGVRLHPWALRALFGVSPGEIRDRSVAARDALGRDGDELRERLDGAPEDAGVGVMVEWLGRRAGLEEDGAEIRARNSSLLLCHRSSCGEAADALGISSRTLRNLMRVHVGLSPKAYARIVRLHRALERAPSGEGWASVAIASGYCDQAHMVREFQRLLGESPEVWRGRAGGCNVGQAASPADPRGQP